jgi:catechol 2,3-dioxygenase-like lactoylglutathione lyase family enzyme
MSQTLHSLALLVRDYDEAIAWYTQVLGFELLEDTALTPEKRWVHVAPPGTTGAGLVLARAATPEQASRIGNQTGGRVFLFLHTTDFWDDYERLKAHGVTFRDEAPRAAAYGYVVVFSDLYGNLWDLIERQAD